MGVFNVEGREDDLILVKVELSEWGDYDEFYLICLKVFG